MNISHRWLLSIAPSITGGPTEIAERLAALGAPADDIEELGAGLGDIVIARVAEVKAHPNADRLRLCVVDAGGAPLQVVCGAPNVEPGGYYPFAPIGARLPDGMQIRKAKLRGETSEGMLCSARELGLGRDHTGLMALAGEWAPGTGFVSALGLDDVRLVLDITPNRPDLLSHVGVARELAPGGNADIRLEQFFAETIVLDTVSGGAEVEADQVGVKIADPADCPRYMAAIVEGVRVGPSPEWLASRLRAIGVRPINNVVDATNYVLHELGQPLHAFDLDTLRGSRIHVRRSRPGESIRTLDGVDRELGQVNLVIADDERPVALAGVMGGEETEVTESSTRLLIECALFDPLVVRKSARALGVSTDASHRFERGVDPTLQPEALHRVVDLILATAGGSVVGPTLDAEPSPSEPRSIRLRPTRIRTVLGVDIPADEVTMLIAPIGFEVESADGRLEILIPPYRPDVTREIDVIEEIARRRGYDSFEAEFAHFRPGTVPEAPSIPAMRAAHDILERWGFLEARTAAFAPASRTRVPLLNPLSAEESHLRDDVMSGLIRRVEHNWAKSVHSIRLYEIASVFRPTESGTPDEAVHLAAVFTGPDRPPHWSEALRPFDLWDVKGLLEEVVADLLPGARIEPGATPFAAIESPAFVVVGPDGEIRGGGGQVRRDAVDAPRWADPLFAIEIELLPTERAVPAFAGLPSFPAVERDLALIIPAGVDAATVERVIRERAGTLLETVRPFDLYEGEGIPPGTRSIAWRLTFRSPERTLTEADVSGPIDSVLAGLEEELRVHRR